MTPDSVSWKPARWPRIARTIGILTLPWMLAGCATFSPDGGMDKVLAGVSSESGLRPVKIASEADAIGAERRVGELLARPLDADRAVQIALLNNRGLQAQYNALGLSEAAFVEASLPPNPTFSLERVASGGELEIERRLVGSLLGLITLPARKAIAEKQFEAAQYQAIGATFSLAAETRRAYYRAVAARQTERFLKQARVSAEAATDLTRKLGETGAATKLSQARAGAFYAEVSNQLAQARLRAGTERERLVRLMGLWGEKAQFRLPRELPNLPTRLKTSEGYEAEAIRKRVDLIAARLRLDALARSLGLTEATRFVSVLDLAGIANYERAREGGHTERAYPKGFELEIQIPIWDLGEVKVRRAGETYMQAVNQLVAKAVDVRSEARAAYLTYRATYDISRQYRREILPLRKIINEQALLEYNGMLIDVFDLLTTARESISSNIAAIEAKRDFHLASVDFEAVLVGGGSAGEGSAESAAMEVAQGGAAEH